MSKKVKAEKKAAAKITNPVTAPPADSKKCPICGRVNDVSNATCTKCQYSFTGKAAKVVKKVAALDEALLAPDKPAKIKKEKAPRGASSLSRVVELLKENNQAQLSDKEIAAKIEAEFGPDNCFVKHPNYIGIKRSDINSGRLAGGHTEHINPYNPPRGPRKAEGNSKKLGQSKPDAEPFMNNDELAQPAQSVKAIKKATPAKVEKKAPVKKAVKKA